MEKYLNKNDLIKGEIYTITDHLCEGKIMIHKYQRMNDPDRSYGFYLCNYGSIPIFSKNTPWLTGRSIKNSTPQQKHWLNECIRLNKYISFEEAMETYIEESNLTLVL